MADEIALVGTSHAYQIPKESPEAAAFEKAVTSFLNSSSFMAIVEEMSSEALAEKGATESICKRVADRRSISHQYCDPDSDTRSRLGIQSENFIRAHSAVSGASKQEIERRVRESCDCREHYWLERMFELDCWPVLFICGADHVDSFAAKAKVRGLSVRILMRDWEPVREG